RLEQGDLQLQIRAGESDRLLRRLALSQQLSGQAVLLGALAIAAAVLAAGARPALALLPGLGALPVALGWLRLSGRIARDLRLDRLSCFNGGRGDPCLPCRRRSPGRPAHLQCATAGCI
ncbi:hypothetical protein KB158_10395, partial [Synechococcus lacustris Cruz CV12-2]|nr:hypothetical protein [Synechococcus lacustris Cruz CV12-2]